MRAYIREELNQHPGLAVPLIQQFSAAFRTGVNGFDQQSYSQLSEIADPDDLSSALTKCSSSDLGGRMREITDAFIQAHRNSRT